MARDDKDYKIKPSYYSPNKSQLKPTKKRSRKKAYLLVLVILLIGAGASADVFAGHLGFKNEAKQVAKIYGSAKEAQTVTPSSTSTSSAPTVSGAAIDTMGQTINSLISSNSGIDISVSLIDLTDNQSEQYGSNDTFQAGSTAKILTAEYFLHEVEEGNQSLTETVGDSSAQDELDKMIVVSDDDAWEDLNEQLGYNALQDYSDKTFGFSDYQAYNNSLSSVDIATALQYLWEDKVLNESDKDLLLSYMKQANYRQFIVPAVPSDDTIYHKIGLYEDYVNDAAIITNGNKAFVIVIFTNGNGVYNWPNRATIMQDITKAALKAYFNQG